MTTTAADSTGNDFRSERGFTANDPTSPQGGDNNKKAPNTDIRVTVSYSEKTGVADGIPRPYTNVLTVSWTLAPEIAPAHHYEVYRDGLKMQLKVPTLFQDQFWLPDEYYTYKVVAINDKNEAYAHGTYVAKTPGMEGLENLLTKIAVFPMRMADSEHPQVDMADMEAAFISAPDSVLNLMQEFSFGKVYFTAEFLNEITLTENIAEYCVKISDEGTGFDCKSSLTAEVKQAVEDAGLMDKFDLIYVPIAGYGPAAAIGGKIVMMAAGSAEKSDVIVHETLHYFGLKHSATWECGEALVAKNIEDPLIEGESWYETYGDRFCPLGFSAYGGMHHVCAVKKWQAGWIFPEHIKEITEAGIYDLWPISTLADGPMMLRIPFPDVNRKIFYFLEYYAPEGLNEEPISEYESLCIGNVVAEGDVPDGVMIRLRYDENSLGKKQLLTENTFMVKTFINQDNSFHDQFRNITIALESYEAGYVRVKITGNLAGKG
jgi:hypothetical protein